MIKLFGKNDTVFNTSNGDMILDAFKANVTKGIWVSKEYYLDIEVPISFISNFVQDRIVVVPTMWGEQAFRIGNVTKKGDRLQSRAYHVSYDSLNYVLIDVYPRKKNGLGVLQWLLDRTDDENPFTCESDILNKHSARYVNKSLFEALIDIEKVWNGHLIADNYKLSLLDSIGKDNGASFRYGVNIQDIQSNEDWSNVCTKLYATGYDGAKIAPLIATTTYEKNYNKVVEFSPSADVDLSSTAAIIEDLQAQAQAYIDVNQFPKINYSLKTYIDNVFDIGDKVLVNHEPLKIDIDAEVYSLTYNVLSKSFTAASFGNYKENVKGLFTSIQAQMEQNKEVTNRRYTALKDAITESKNLIDRFLFEGHKYETDNATYYLNAEGVENATKFLIISLGGIGFGTKEVGEDITQAEYTTIWDIEGNFNAKCITAGTIKSISIDTEDLFAQDITATGTIRGAKLVGGTFEATATGFINPGYKEWDMIGNYVKGTGTLTAAQKTASDFNRDRVVNLADSLICRKLVEGDWTIADVTSRYGYIPKQSTIKVTINPSLPSKAIRITGTNAWGRTIDYYLGVDGINSNKLASDAITGGFVRTTSGADLDELNSNLINLGKFGVSKGKFPASSNNNVSCSIPSGFSNSNCCQIGIVANNPNGTWYNIGNAIATSPYVGRVQYTANADYNNRAFKVIYYKYA